MSETTTTLKSIKMTHTEFNIPQVLPANFALKVGRKAQFKLPKDPAVKSMLLNIELTITAPDAEDFKIFLVSNCIFSFDQMPEDSKKAAQELCAPIAQKTLLETVDNILTFMGYPTLNLTRQED